MIKIQISIRSKLKISSNTSRSSSTFSKSVVYLRKACWKSALRSVGRSWWMTGSTSQLSSSEGKLISTWASYQSHTETSNWDTLWTPPMTSSKNTASNLKKWSDSTRRTEAFNRLFSQGRSQKEARKKKKMASTVSKSMRKNSMRLTPIPLIRQDPKTFIHRLIRGLPIRI